MIIDEMTLIKVQEEAEDSPRLRANYCLHNNPNEKVQKMINYLLPGTDMPIHCHINSAETLIVLKGEITIVYYDDNCIETGRFILNKSSCLAIDIPKKQWHNIIVTEPVALFEIKEGPYRPLLEIEIKQLTKTI